VDGPELNEGGCVPPTSAGTPGNEPDPGQPPRREAPGARPRRADVWQLFDTLQKEEAAQAKLFVNSAGIKLVLIPAGTFLMGSPESEPGHRLNEGPEHEVSITRPFYLGVAPVTQGQYEQVLGKNPARFHAGTGGGPDHPVETVSWEDAAAFCRRLSERAEESRAGRVYRLPTEAEWEYTCRSGTATPFSPGAALSSRQANFDGAYPGGGATSGPALKQTSRVGSYPANNFGLCDVHGNVWEWCADWYAEDYYRVSPRRDPPGPAAGQFRVLRGGCWRSQAATCRAAYRNALPPSKRDAYTGFRVVAVVSAAS
jgi:formylglycine-generating enzyme required for sulfatase activity